ncbi:MAG: CocE/NonD family hydrolase [Planctomycetota bacterium]
MTAHARHRHHLLALLALLLLLPARPAPTQDPAPADPAAPPAPAWRAEMRDVQIPMRDGKSLAANVLLPTTPGKYPCILVQTPYNKDRMGREFGDDDDAPGGALNAGRGSQKAFAKFDRNNYGWIFVDWRGFYASKAAAQGQNRRGWKRGQDGYDCVEWIAAQSWSDGKVGTWGGSALGKQQFDTATEQPPHLVCAVPLIAAQGFRYSTYYEGGVQIESAVKAHDRLGFGVGQFVNGNRLPSRMWDLAERLSYHPERINVPCLLVSGWWDNYPREVIEHFNDILSKGKGKAGESKLIMGPWSHTAIDIVEQGDLKFPDAEFYSTNITTQFFDYYLRGKLDSGWKAQPRVHMFQCGEGWVTGDSVAALQGKPRTMYLHVDGVIRDAAPTAPAPAADGSTDPLTRAFDFNPAKASPTIGGQNLPPLTHGPKDCASIERRGDVLVYRTAELTAPLCIRGEIALRIPFSCNRTDADLHVRVCDSVGASSGAHSYLVGETCIRASLRDGKAEQFLTAGQVVELELRLPPHAYTFAPGHRLTLIITGASVPRYETNDKAGDVVETLYHQPDRCARLALPVVDPLKKSDESERTR